MQYSRQSRGSESRDRAVIPVPQGCGEAWLAELSDCVHRSILPQTAWTVTREQAEQKIISERLVIAGDIIKIPPSKMCKKSIFVRTWVPYFPLSHLRSAFWQFCYQLYRFKRKATSHLTPGFQAMHSSIILSEVLGIKNSSATSSAFQTTTDLKFGFGKI